MFETHLISTIHIINGPNLNLLGRREPAIYGHVSFEDYFQTLKARYSTIQLTYDQSNHEGRLIDLLHEYGFNPSTGIIMNAGGYTHTSIALRDAIAAIESPVVEVHISDITKREAFRHHSYLSEVCYRHLAGHGLDGYRMAIDQLLAYTPG